MVRVYSNKQMILDKNTPNCITIVFYLLYQDNSQNLSIESFDDGKILFLRQSLR